MKTPKSVGSIYADAMKDAKRVVGSSPPPSLDSSAPSLPPLIVDPNNGSIYAPGPLLGRGGFAYCFLFSCTKTGLEYAAKVIPKVRLSKSSHREKVLREIGIHQTLSHKHVVRLISAFENSDNIIIVLECCHNQSLVQILRQRGQLSEAEVKFFFSQFLEGLRYLHEDCRILHRDLKLGNLLISEDLQLKIADFGFAVKLPSDTCVSGTQGVCGTPNYLAPELLRFEGSSYASEAWATGCVLYALLVGKPPFETSSLQETYARIRANCYSIPSFVGGKAKDLISRLLAPDGMSRPRVSDCLRHPFLQEEISCDSGYFTPDYLFSATKPFYSSTKNSRGSSSDNSGQNGLSQGRSVKNDQRPKLRSEIQRVDILPTDSSNRLDDGRSSHKRFQLRSFSSSGRKTETKLKVTDLLDVRRSSESSASPVSFSSHSWSPVEEFCGISTAAPTIRTWNNAGALIYNELSNRLSSPPDGSPLVRVSLPILYCSRWIDYTNRYGFATQFTDGSLAVWFNDGCRICLSADTRVYRYLKDSSSDWLVFQRNTEMPDCVRVRVSLLHHFSKYMEENLISAPEVSSDPVDTVAPHIHQWCRRDGCMAMLISNGTYQVNFTEEHLKLIVSPMSGRSGTFAYLFTVINSSRHSESFPLLALPQLCKERPALARFAQIAKLLLKRLLVEGRRVS